MIQSIGIKKIFVVFISTLLSNFVTAQNITTVFEKSNGTKTPTYHEAIDWWQKLDAQSGKVKCSQWE
jgi:hypothetical protein